MCKCWDGATTSQVSVSLLKAIYYFSFEDFSFNTDAPLILDNNFSQSSSFSYLTHSSLSFIKTSIYFKCFIVVLSNGNEHVQTFGNAIQYFQIFTKLKNFNFHFF